MSVIINKKTKPESKANVKSKLFSNNKVRLTNTKLTLLVAGCRRSSDVLFAFDLSVLLDVSIINKKEMPGSKGNVQSRQVVTTHEEAW